MESLFNIESVMKQLVNFGTTYGLQVIGAVVILIVSRIVAGSHQLSKSKGTAEMALICSSVFLSVIMMEIH
jgi:hypothetical protein